MFAIVVLLADVTALEGVLLGALLSIPIAIFAPLVTPRLAQWVGRRSKERAKIRRDSLQQQLAKIREYVENPDAWHSYMLLRVLLTTLLSAMTAVTSGLFFAASIIPGLSDSIGGDIDLERFTVFTGQLVAVGGSAIVVGVVIRTFDVIRKVNSFSSFEKYVQDQLEELESPSP